MRMVRILVDVLLIFGFAVMFFTGVGLFLAPAGRVAKITGWNWFGMSKEMLEDVHAYFGFAMIATVFVHLYLNYRPLKIIFKSLHNIKIAASIALSLVLLIAGAYVSGVVW